LKQFPYLIVKYNKGVIIMTFRLFLMAIVTVFLLVGCGRTQVDNIDFKTENSRSEAFPPSIPGYIQANEMKFEMVQGGFKWETKHQAVMTDAASPNQIAEKFEAVAIAPKTRITILLEGQPDLQVFLWEGDQRSAEISLSKDQFTLPEMNGRYVYEVVAKWSNWGNDNARGEVSYTFVVEIK
jgi:hypothetical protein